MSHDLANIPEAPLDKTCTRCGACLRNTSEWFMLGYSRREPHQPPCTTSLKAIEEWAQVPPRERASSVRQHQVENYIAGHSADAHLLRKKW